MEPIDTMHAFDGKAELYARNRRDYAPRAIAAIVAIAGLDRTSAIADLGAGTGMLTRHFADRVGRVFAIEPNADMRTAAWSNLERFASVNVIDGTAHATGLPDHCVDAVTAGRAIHWFDAGPTQTEIRRILRPGGWLVVVRTPVTDAYSSAALERLRDERISRRVANHGRVGPRADVGHYFGGDNYIRLTYPCTTRESWPQFFGRMQSFSFSPQPGDAKHRAFERVAREIFDAGAADGLLRVEYATEVMMKQVAPAVAVRPSIPFSEAEIEQDIVTRFERVAAGVPDVAAVKTADDAWTYRQLDAVADGIAEIVRRDSPDPSKPVALLFDHGLAGVAAILGALKAGRAYCAISPAHPVDRHRETLADLGATLLLCADSRLGLARQIVPPDGQCVAIEPRRLHGGGRGPERARSADDVAAVCYTSGTTGKPKGVALSHRYLLHRAWLSARMLGVAIGDPMSQIAEISFATGATDVFVALLSGATLCPFDAREGSLRQLALWLNRDRIAILRMPVALFHQFLDALDAADRFPHVRYLQPAGKLEWSGVDRYRKHFGRECRLVRQLAATETSLLTAMMVDHDTPRSGATVPVGYPVPGKEIRLQGDNGAPVEGDAIGEIVVKSRYLFSGIWGQPGTFLPPGQAREHRMGDLGRWLPDGSLEFVGRIDSRVKIRGFTVDLEQVEAAIGDTGVVVDAAVAAIEDGPHEQRLVAHVVPAHAGVTAGDIRARLVERIPDYMIPSRFVLLAALPLTPNGKIDRAALAQLRPGRAEPAPGAIAAQTPTEAAVHAIWVDALKVAHVGIDDDFLQIGGDSLTAARIASRILACFGVELTSRELFDAPTIARMAALIDQRQRDSRGPGGR